MYRYAVLGLGEDGLRHVRALKEVMNADCVAVYDSDSEKLEESHALFPDVPGFTSAVELLSSFDLDGAVVTAGETGLIPEIACFLPRIFADLPDSLGLSGLDMLAKAAGEAGSEIAIYQPGIFDKCFNNARRCCDKDLAGKLREIRGKRAGGPLWGLIAQFLALAGSPVKGIEEREDGEISILFSNNVIARTEGGISGDRWTLRGDAWTVHLGEVDRVAGSDECSDPRHDKAHGNGLDACYVNYFNSLEGREELRSSLSDARRAFSLMDTLATCRYRFA